MNTAKARELHDKVQKLKLRIQEVQKQLKEIQHLDSVTCTHEVGSSSWDGRAETILVNTPACNVRVALQKSIDELKGKLTTAVDAWVEWASDGE